VKSRKIAKTSSTGKSTNKKKAVKNETTELKKQYLKSTGACKVTFSLPKAAAPEAKVVTLVGDFNNWNETEAQMKKLKNGNFKITLELSSEKEYKYRYLIDSSRWENDWQADSYIPNPFGCDDSLVKV
jgi:1,4-alpha-glucan branching enzyme